MYIVCPDFHKSFDKISHAILIEKFLKNGLNDNMIRSIQNYIDDQTQKGIVNVLVST